MAAPFNPRNMKHKKKFRGRDTYVHKVLLIDKQPELDVEILDLICQGDFYRNEESLWIDYSIEILEHEIEEQDEGAGIMEGMLNLFKELRSEFPDIDAVKIDW